MDTLRGTRVWVVTPEFFNEATVVDGPEQYAETFVVDFVGSFGDRNREHVRSANIFPTAQEACAAWIRCHKIPPIKAEVGHWAAMAEILSPTETTH